MSANLTPSSLNMTTTSNRNRRVIDLVDHGKACLQKRGVSTNKVINLMVASMAFLGNCENRNSKSIPTQSRSGTLKHFLFSQLKISDEKYPSKILRDI